MTVNTLLSNTRIVPPAMPRMNRVPLTRSPSSGSIGRSIGHSRERFMMTATDAYQSPSHYHGKDSTMPDVRRSMSDPLPLPNISIS